MLRYAATWRFGIWIAFATSFGVAPSPSKARISKSNETDASPASVYAARE